MDATDHPGPSRWRWVRRFGLVLLLGLGVYGWLHYRADSAYRKALAALDRDDPGWRLDDLEAARAEIPEEENSARIVVATAALLPAGWPGDFPEPLQDLAPNERLRRENYHALRAETDEWATLLDPARRLAGMPRGRHRLTLARPLVIGTMLDDQQQTRAVAALLRYAALRRADEGDIDGALADCRAIFNAGRSLGDEPFIISQLIRVACVAIACQTAERVLAQGEPSPAELAALQKLLEEEDAFPGLWLSLRGERGMSHDMIIALEDGTVPLSALAGGPGTPSATERLLGGLLRPSFKAEHPGMLDMMTRRVEAAKLPPHEQAAEQAAFNAEVAALPRTAVLTRLLLPAVDKIAQSFRRKHGQLRSLSACVAAERFRRANSRWPETLDQLVPSYLAAVPLDPYDGQPLRYKRLADGVIAYAVGPDLIDDGGKFDRANPTAPGTDLGYRLWDMAQRRQEPRPLPVEDKHP